MSPDEAIARIAARQYATFDRGQAIDIGFTKHSIDHRIQSGRWETPHRGVYRIAGSPRSTEGRIIAATLAYGSRASASHTDAAYLLGIVQETTGVVRVMLTHANHRQGVDGVIPHQGNLGKGDRRIARGIRVTAPARTIIDLATLLTPERLEAAVDTAILGGLTTAERVFGYIEQRNLGRKRGSAVLQRILRDRFDGALQLELERIFARKIARSALPSTVRQFRVGSRRIDFAYPGRKVAIELDGLGHATGAIFRDDRHRQNDIVLAGWLVLRFTYEDVDRDWPRVEATIAAALEERRRVG